MFLLDSGSDAAGRPPLVTSPSDLRLASACEFHLVRELDVVLDRAERPPVEADQMARRVIDLGNAHEQRELRRLAHEHPGRVVQLPRPAYSHAGLTDAAEATLAALRSDAEVVYQATFFDGGFVGHADFLEHTPEGWLVTDTKLARSDSVPALLQIAAYAAALAAAGVPAAPTARLVLGSGAVSEHPLTDIVPAYRARRARLDSVLAEHRDEDRAASWGDPRWLACGRCDVCAAEAERVRDVLLVSGVRLPTRRRLADAGITTIDELAASRGPVADVRDSTLTRLRAQARLQLAAEADPSGAVAYEVTDAEVLRRLPAPSEGDIFFDFEGDPLWSEPGSGVWGLEYLFGLVEVDGLDVAGGEPPRFRAFWAHDRAEERQALIDFVAYLSRRRRRWPDLHVYHYAAYEPSALLRLAARHGVCEDDIDQLLRDGVFVDLYAVVRASVLVSQRSYSLKKLEPLYMAGRSGEVTKADESIVVYHGVIDARIAGRTDEAARLLAGIASYNEDDCVSTLRLRDWLRARVAGEEPTPSAGSDLPVPVPLEVSERRQRLIDLEGRLRALVADVKPHERTPAQQAVAMVAASLQFHAREDKPFWWRHFDRLRSPVGDWVPEPGVFVVDRCEVLQGWHRATARQRPRRIVRLSGEPLGGVLLGPGVAVSAIYRDPPPAGVTTQPGHLHARSSATIRILEAEETIAPNGRTHQVLTLEELQPRGGEDHVHEPVALVPSGIIPTTKIDDALAQLAEEVLAAHPALPNRAGLDLLARRPPRLRTRAALPRVGAGPDRFADAITAAVLDLDSSMLAVQGPPGTGKTHVGARVIATLVRHHGWRVGVSAQSHAAVENLLTAVVAAGVPGGLVGKNGVETDNPTWTDVGSSDALAEFAAGREAGYVVGGTAWDLCHEGRVGRGDLDLLVVDEAGQFSLAKTLAVSVAAERLLLLGDPQQLPQVSQGSHPEPVDDSALGWLIGDAAVLPSSRGYFLETTWRMHPALTAPVSRLAYAGRLRSEERVTRARRLDGIPAGLHIREVEHHDNATHSAEEADVVLALARDLLGRTWVAPDEPAGAAGRPLQERDLCVITPYNAQVTLLRAVLDEAGLTEVPVGTVDKFQGRQAVVVLVSMAASAHADVARGVGFLLDRHRLNVAISRGKWAAYLVRSAALTDAVPRSPAELIALGAFLGLADQASSSSSYAMANGSSAKVSSSSSSWASATVKTRTGSSPSVS